MPMKKLLTLLLIAAVGGAGWWYRAGEETPGAARYRTQAVDRGDIVQTISANGTLNPVTARPGRHPGLGHRHSGSTPTSTTW